MSRFSSLGDAIASFENMMKRFGVVTVMNAKVYNTADLTTGPIKDYFNVKTAEEIANDLSSKTELCYLDTLKIANITTEGPTKTVNGGQYSNPLIKFGKSARLEMQDALGNNKALDALCGTVSEYSDSLGGEKVIALHVTEDFAGPRTIVGDSFFIDQKTGRQVPVKILFYQFLPDSIFNLTQDAEGDATVFDMNGDLMTTNILVGSASGNTISHGVFYSIVSANPTAVTNNPLDKTSVEVIVNGDSVTVTSTEDITSATSESEDIDVDFSGKELTIAAVEGANAGTATVAVTTSTGTYNITVTIKTE